MASLLFVLTALALSYSPLLKQQSKKNKLFFYAPDVAHGQLTVGSCSGNLNLSSNEAMCDHFET